ncbi:MAG TPA: phenylalanine--tRNA ligase subunit beta [Gemmatimonadaceae bacterium]|nr:phenylalanine--tRNA ligase subunit beta [Gemmatimonadaceae bacterium]
MNVSYDWLRAFVGFQLTPAKLRDLITSRVATVDELEPLNKALTSLVVARVVEAGPHPDSDHLWVTKVDAGTGVLLDVVCGAPNVKAGALYPFAPVGTTMPNGLKIEKRRIRGQTSNGMLCSPREIGLGDDHEGILELSTDVKPGTPFLKVMPAGDTRIVIDVMPNRPDLLSHLGVAREIAAAVDSPLTLPELEGAGAAVPAAQRVRSSGRTGPVEVRVDEEGLCRRYMAVVIRGVRVGPSPEWLVNRLEAIDSRSINNVVDATNYVLHELGQPTHAFDLAKLGGSTVIVRRSRAGERITTLDGADRALADTMTVIADAKRPQAIAGVMGGRDSEVSEATTDLLLEVASFDPPRTRATRRALGLSTDASYRFERGVDPALAPAALERTARVIIAVAGGRVDDVPIDIYSGEPLVAPMTLRASRVARVLGESISADEAASLLRSVGFDARVESPDMVRVMTPTWRSDILREIDLIEEVARLRGYDSFPDEIRPFRAGNVPDDPQWLTARRVRNALAGAGLLETRPMPFVAGADRGYVQVANPLAANEAYLRRDILDTLARRAEYNLARMQADVRIFELGSVFTPTDGPMPREELHVGALIMGRRQPPHFSDPKSDEFEKAMTFDAWDAKALAETIARESFAGMSIEVEDGGEGDLWRISANGAHVGVVRPVALDAPVWAKKAFGVELSLGVFDSTDVAPAGAHAYRTAEYPPVVVGQFRPLPTQPSSSFEMSLAVPAGVRASQIEQAVRQVSGDMLESLQLVDEYAGKNIEPGYRSLAWRLTFRHPERTITAKEIEGRRTNVLRHLEKTLNVRARTT